MHREAHEHGVGDDRRARHGAQYGGSAAGRLRRRAGSSCRSAAGVRGRWSLGASTLPARSMARTWTTPSGARSRRPSTIPPWPEGSRPYSTRSTPEPFPRARATTVTSVTRCPVRGGHVPDARVGARGVVSGPRRRSRAAQGGSRGPSCRRRRRRPPPPAGRAPRSGRSGARPGRRPAAARGGWRPTPRGDLAVALRSPRPGVRPVRDDECGLGGVRDVRGGAGDLLDRGPLLRVENLKALARGVGHPAGQGAERGDIAFAGSGDSRLQRSRRGGPSRKPAPQAPCMVAKTAGRRRRSVGGRSRPASAVAVARPAA